MAVAALENILHKDCGPAASQQRRHQNGLTVGGEPRIGGGAYRRYRLQAPLAAQPDTLLAAVDAAARLLQGGGHGGQMPAVCLPQQDIAASRRSRAQVGGGHDPICNDPVAAPVERPFALHGDDRAARAPHLRAAGTQKIL